MPDWSEAIRERLRGLNLDGAREAEIIEELSQHLGDRYAEMVAGGATEDHAIRSMMEELQGSDLLEGLRNARQPAPREPLGLGASGGTGALGGLGHDLKVAVRSIRVNPAFSLTVVLMLALGVAGTTAIFSIFNGMFLRPLPFPAPGRLVDLNEAAPKWNLAQVSVSNPDYVAWTKGNSSFDGMAFFSGGGANLSDSSGLARRIQTAQVTHDLLDVLGLKPALGRNFFPEEDRPGGAKVVLLGYDLWRSLFHGDPNVAGRIVKLDEQPYTVIGVLPREAVPPEAEAWLPLAADPNQGNSYYLAGIGRLKAGVSMDRAKADLMRVHKGMIQSVKAYVNELTFPTVIPLRDRYLGDFKTVTNVLLGAVGVVLLIACVNIAGLMMVRGEARAREIAIRAAVGASRLRIVRQLLTESLVLAVLGGAVGVLAGKACLAAMVSLMPDDIPHWIGFGWDARFAVFSILVTGAAAVIFGLAPALQAAAVDALSCLQEASRSSMSRGRHRILSGLVVCEIALACILLVCSGLLIQAFRKVLHVDPGIRTDHVMTWRLELPEAKYPKAEQQLAAYRDLVSRLKALPGVTAVSGANLIPLAGGHEGNFFLAEGAPPLGRNEQNPVILTVAALPGYFETMGMTLLKGRWFTDQDLADHAPQVAIVSETFAKRFWPGQNPVGKRIRYASEHETPWMQVVGLSRDTRHYGLDVEMRPEVFLPYTVSPRIGLALVLRSSVDASGLVAPVRETIRQADPGLAMFQVRTMTEWLNRSLWTRRACSWLFGAFAAVAILLAVAGIYGVVSFAVSRRTREIGIRIALGARPGDVMLRVLAGGTVLVGIGLIVGLAASMAVANVLESMLFGVSGRDFATYGAVAALVVSVGALANSIPARRAASVDPIRALRFE